MWVTSVINICSPIVTNAPQLTAGEMVGRGGGFGVYRNSTLSPQFFYKPEPIKKYSIFWIWNYKLHTALG